MIELSGVMEDGMDLALYAEVLKMTINCNHDFMILVNNSRRAPITPKLEE